MPDAIETPQQRRARYLRLALKAQELADRCPDPQVSAGFREIARSWEVLAREIARRNGE